MKKIVLSKETLRTLTAQESDAVAGGRDVQVDGAGDDRIGIGPKLDTQSPCQTFPVRICVTGRC